MFLIVEVRQRHLFLSHEQMTLLQRKKHKNNLQWLITWPRSVSQTLVKSCLRTESHWWHGTAFPNWSFGEGDYRYSRKRMSGSWANQFRKDSVTQNWTGFGTVGFLKALNVQKHVKGGCSDLTSHACLLTEYLCRAQRYWGMQTQWFYPQGSGQSQ